MPKWTPDQQTAIDDRGGALLVSAAAGSGKTAVLTERVLRRLTDENDPVDIDRLLLVTFTNAAAAEMRERIGAALGAAVAANPRDTRLRRQLFLVHRAKITTVHALCLSLAVLGIAPDFRLMDENEGKLLRAEVLEEVLDTAYEQADEKFFALCDLLTAGRDDQKLGEVILGTYEKIQAHPDPRAFLEDVRAGLYTRGMDTPHGCVLREQARSAAQHGAAFLHMAVDELTGIDELADNYLPALTSDLNQAERLLDVLYNGSWDDCVKAARSISFDRLKAARKFEDKAFLEQIKAMREEWKSVAKNIREKWLTVTAEEAEYDRGLTAPALFALRRRGGVRPRPDSTRAVRAHRHGKRLRRCLYGSETCKKCCGFQRFGALCRASAVYRRQAVRTGENHVRAVHRNCGGRVSGHQRRAGCHLPRTLQRRDQPVHGR